MESLRQRVVSFVGQGVDGAGGRDESALSGLYTAREIDACHRLMREMVLNERKDRSERKERKDRPERSEGTKRKQMRTAAPPTMRKEQRTQKEVAQEEQASMLNDSLEIDTNEEEVEDEDVDVDEDVKAVMSGTVSPSKLDAALVAARGASAPPLSPTAHRGSIARPPLVPHQQQPQQPLQLQKSQSSRTEAFNRFKSQKGHLIATELRQAKVKKRDLKSELKKQVEAANEAKRNIDASLQALERYRARTEEMQRGARGILLEDDEEGERVVMEAEEYELLKTIKQHKRAYREYFQQIKELKKRLQHQQGVIDRTRQTLVEEFENEFSRAALPSSTQQLSKSRSSKLAFTRAQSFQVERKNRMMK